jgi:hypothetical protein
VTTALLIEPAHILATLALVLLTEALDHQHIALFLPALADGPMPTSERVAALYPAERRHPCTSDTAPSC